METFFEKMGFSREPSSLLRFSNKLGVLLAQGSGSGTLQPFITYLALSGPVNVLDAGNNFDLISVAYSIRKLTQSIYEVADRIHIVRAFTCIEVLKALEEQKTGTPLVVINMLATFYDEAVTHQRIHWLMGRCLEELARLKQSEPIVISVNEDCPADSPRKKLLDSLLQAADVIFRPQEIKDLTQERLF